MAERKTNARSAMIIAIGLAAATKIEAGKLAVINALGYGAEGSEALGLKAIGRWCATVDNSAGANGALTGEAEFDRSFQWKNSALDAVDQSCVGKEVFIEDDETVSKTDNAGARSSGGICIGFDADGVWTVPALPASRNAAELKALLGLTPSTHVVIAAGIHEWAGGAAATDSIAVVGLLETDVVQATLVARAGAEVLELAANDAGNDQIDLTLSANGTDGTTKVAWSVLRAIA
jgi:hypothetical protein